MDSGQIGRPRKVGIAVKLLYISLGMAVVKGILQVSMSGKQTSVESVIFAKSLGYGISWLLIHMIGQGRNWARITWLVLFLYGVLAVLPGVLEILGKNPIYGLVVVGLMLPEAIALILLFQKQSSDWFKEMKYNRSGKRPY